MKEVCLLGFLGWNAWSDIKDRKISLGMTILMIAAGILWSIWSQKSMWSLAGAILMGILFCCISLVSNGEIGMGDGLIILALGSWLEAWDMMIFVLWSLLGCAVWSMILLFLFHKNRKTEIPFVPFLCLSYLGELLWKIG